MFLLVLEPLDQLCGDTTATGERVDTNTVYILEKDGEYILDGEFSPRYPVNIEAAAGSGASLENYFRSTFWW